MVKALEDLKDEFDKRYRRISRRVKDIKRHLKRDISDTIDDI